MVTQRPNSRRARKRAETRERIIMAAIEVFSRRGIDHATVDEIAAAADVGKGTIYNYFDTKEDIVVAFMAGFEHKVQRKVDGLLERADGLEELLTAYVRLQLDMKAKHHPFVRVFLAQMFARTEAFLPWMQELQNVIDPPLMRLFSGLHDRKLLRPDIELPMLVHVFKTIQLGLTALWAVEGPPWHATHKTIEEEIRLFCRGIGGRSR